MAVAPTLPTSPPPMSTTEGVGSDQPTAAPAATRRQTTAQLEVPPPPLVRLGDEAVLQLACLAGLPAS